MALQKLKLLEPGAPGGLLDRADTIPAAVAAAVLPQPVPLAIAEPAAAEEPPIAEEPAAGAAPRPPGREGPLTVLEERRLARRWRTLEDADALARLVSAHLGLVIRIAMEFRHSGPAMEDLIQEGNLGLTIAARRFDPNRATRLATYATYWIRACMLEHVVRSHGPVRIGTTRSQRKIFFGLGRARRKLERDGEVADCEKLAGELGVMQEDVEAMTPRLTGRDVSLDAPRSFDDRRSTGANLAIDGPSPEEVVAGCEEDDHRREQLFEGLKVLDPRERAIIRARHMRQRPATLAALGKKFGISRERVRQLELRAKDKLRQFCGVE
jgi:RNA polymerase sigma-32 factor